MIDNVNLDGGYGWVIVLAFFIVEVLVDGVRFSYGLFYIEFLSEFNKGKANTAWIGAIMIGVYNLGGPVFAFIVNKVGYRNASILGSLIATTGFVMSYFATELYHLYLTYGVLQGFGSGLVFLSGAVAVGRYFRKKRALAIGISFCGSGVGTFIISPLSRQILEWYSWRGCMFIMAGLALNCCVFSTLYRPIKEEEFEIDLEIHTGAKIIDGDVVNDSNGKVTNGHTSHEALNSPLLRSANHSLSLVNGKTTLSPPLRKSFVELRKEHLYGVSDKNIHGSNRSLNMSILSQSMFGSNASFEYIFEKRAHSRRSNLSIHVPSITSNNTGQPQSDKQFQNGVIESMFPKALVTNINFIIMMTSTIFIGIPSFVPFSMLPDYAISIGSSPLQSAWLISAIGIGGTFSRIGVGILADMQCVNRLTLNGVCYLVLGVTTIVAGLLPIYEVLVVYATLFGIFFGALYVVQPIVLLEYFGEEYISEVLGIIMCVYGVSAFIGSPSAGFIFDMTGSYNVSFLASGASFLFGGVIHFFVLCTKPSRKARRQAKLQQRLDTIDET